MNSIEHSWAMISIHLNPDLGSFDGAKNHLKGHFHNAIENVGRQWLFDSLITSMEIGMNAILVTRVYTLSMCIEFICSSAVTSLNI